jgi:hypothetical protein
MGQYDHQPVDHPNTMDSFARPTVADKHATLYAHIPALLNILDIQECKCFENFLCGFFSSLSLPTNFPTYFVMATQVYLNSCHFDQKCYPFYF